MFNIRDLINSLGTVKNPVLFCSTSMAFLLLYFYHEPHDDLFSKLVAVVMCFWAIVIFLIGIGFYIYAFLRLPSSTQELVFLEEGKLALARYRRAAPKPKFNKRAEDE
jgi:drug/metabolite transporter (DMT)-like permease